MSGAGLRFTEVMTGYVAFVERDHLRGATVGQATRNRLRLRLTIDINDLTRFAADPHREGTITGWVQWEALGGRLPIARGVFNLLVDGEDDHRMRMRYRLFFRDGVGHPVTLVGEKRVGSPGFRLWSDTTTLYVRALSGSSENEDTDETVELIASGILRLHLLAFAWQLLTFRATGRSFVARIGTIARFDALFLRQLWRAYAPALPPSSPVRSSRGRPH